MNLQEFAALKVGDKIENPADGGASVGEIVETLDRGVRVVWGAAPRSRDAVFLQRCRHDLDAVEQGSAVSWTKERTARLRELHARGLSSREIAHKLDVSRDSVIGKLSRLKIRTGNTRVAKESLHKSRQSLWSGRRRAACFTDNAPRLPTFQWGSAVRCCNSAWASANGRSANRSRQISFSAVGAPWMANRIVNTTAASPISPGDSQPLAVLLFRAFGYERANAERSECRMFSAAA